MSSGIYKKSHLNTLFELTSYLSKKFTVLFDIFLVNFISHFAIATLFAAAVAAADLVTSFM